GALVEKSEIDEREDGAGMLGAEHLFADRERALRRCNGLLVPPRSKVLPGSPVQSLRFGRVTFFGNRWARDREREQKVRGGVPFVQSTRAPALHRNLPFNQ